MTVRAKCALLLTLLFVCPSSLFADEPITFRPLGVAQGLDVKVVSSLMVDRSGFLWVATREGLFRYDGYEARRIPSREGGVNALPDSDLRSLFESDNGQIWISSNTAGLSRYDPKAGRFTHFRHDPSDPHTLTHESIYGVTEDEEGWIWAGSQIGLNRMDPSTGEVQRFYHDPDDPHSLSHNYVYALHAAGGGTIWVATIGGGISIKKPGNRGFDRIDLALELRGEPELNDVFAFAEHPGGSVYAGTRGGLVVIDPGSRKVRKIDVTSAEGWAPTIIDLEWGPAGKLWMATLATGLLVYDPDSGQVEQANPEALGQPGQLPAIPQTALAISRGKVFTGTWGDGVYHGRLGLESFRFADAERESSRFRHRNVTAILAGKERLPLLGSFGGGIQTLSEGGEQAGFLLREPAGLATHAVLSMVRRRDGSLVAATTDGLWILQADGRNSEYVDAGSGVGFGAGYATSVVEDERGALWVGVGGSGLFHRESGSKQFESFQHDPARKDSLSGNYISALMDIGGGYLLVGTRSSGLNLCRTRQWSCERYGVRQGLGHHNVTHLLQVTPGEFWVGTDGGGLHHFLVSESGQVKLLRRWTKRDGLLSDSVMGLVADDDGSIWVSSRGGLSRLQPRSGEVVNHVGQSGLPVTHFNAHAADRDDEYLYFGALGGLVSIPAGTPMQQHEPSPVRLVELTRPDREVGITTQPISALTEYAIDWGEMLSVSYAVLDFAGSSHEYEYRLSEGADWHPLGNRRYLTLLELAPGKHQLSIRGRDVFGNWGQSPSLELEVIPPPWMTTEFRLGGIFLLIIGAWTWHRYRMRGLRRRNRLLEDLQREKERALEQAKQSQSELARAHSGLRNLTNRLQTAREDQRQQIARELHDELGQTLTATKISLQRVRVGTSGEKERSLLDASVEMMSRMISQVRSISLSLRPPLLDEAGLVEALRVHLNSVADRAGIRVEFRAVEELTEITEELRTTTFRLVQEAVSNILRHAEASNVCVKLSRHSGGLLLEVSDNGRGFEPTRVWERIWRGEHLGLLGMLERVHAAGGEMRFESEPGRGCRVIAKLPVKS